MDNILRIPGIYKIVNSANNKIYIGSSKNMNTRLRGHRTKLKKNQHCNTHLQSSFNKYGENNFIYECIEYCEENNLIEKEQFYVNKLNVLNPKIGYNKASDIKRTSGNKWSEESRKKLSESKKGLKIHPNTLKALINANKKRTYKKGFNQDPIGARKGALGRSSGVLQYDLDGFFIKEWSNSILATEFYSKKGKCNIKDCTNGKRFKAHEYQWFHIPENKIYPKKIMPYKRKNSHGNLKYFMRLCLEISIEKESELLENPEEDNQQPS